jgi:hypothetical protein
LKVQKEVAWRFKNHHIQKKHRSWKQRSISKSKFTFMLSHHIQF